MALRRVLTVVLLACLAGGLAVALPTTATGHASLDGRAAGGALAANAPNIYFYNLDDLRDAVPQGLDPLQFMPEVRAWMSAGTRYRNSFVVDPACCPSRASMLTGRYPHNNGVRLQAQGPQLDKAHSMSCYLQQGGYRTYMAGKFLTTWPKSSRPPCFTHSTVMWTGYRNSEVSIDGVLSRSRGYSTTYLAERGRDYIRDALTQSAPFLLYEAPQAPHWSQKVTAPDGTVARVAVPEATYAQAPVPSCVGPSEADRSDKPTYVRNTNVTASSTQTTCASQIRTLMTADDEFGATMQLLSDRGVLDETLVIFSSDNGYLWGEHGRTEKFAPYEPSIRVPMLVRWPGVVPAGTNTNRLVTYLDLLPTMLDAAGIPLPAGAPRLDGESLLDPSTRTTVFGEYYIDSANGKIQTWKMVRTADVKYVHTYNKTGGLVFREYYDLTADPIENVNLLADGNPANDPPASEVTALRSLLDSMATCAGSTCVR